jgi:hypothetical protein
MRRSRPMRAAVVQIAKATRTAVKSQLPEYQAREVALALERVGASVVVRMDQSELCIITYSPDGFTKAKRILGRIPSIKRFYEDTYVDHEFDDEVYCEARYRLAA